MMPKTYTLELKPRELFRNHSDWYEEQYSQRKIKHLNELRKRIEVIRKEQK